MPPYLREEEEEEDKVEELPPKKKAEDKPKPAKPSAATKRIASADGKPQSRLSVIIKMQGSGKSFWTTLPSPASKGREGGAGGGVLLRIILGPLVQGTLAEIV